MTVYLLTLFLKLIHANYIKIINAFFKKTTPVKLKIFSRENMYYVLLTLSIAISTDQSETFSVKVSARI